MTPDADDEPAPPPPAFAPCGACRYRPAQPPFRLCGHCRTLAHRRLGAGFGPWPHAPRAAPLYDLTDFHPEH